MLQVASVMSNSVWPRGLQPTRLLRPWDSPGKNTGVGCHFLLQYVSIDRFKLPLNLCKLLPLDCEESWEPKNWCFWTVVLEKTLEKPLHWKKIQPVHPKGDQSWVFIGRTDAEAETPILWPPHAKSWFIGKDPNAGRDWGHDEKGRTEDEMAG